MESPLSVEKPLSNEQLLEKMIQKKTGVARMLANLDQIISTDADISLEALEENIDGGLLEYQIDPEQLELFKNGAIKYFEKHKAISKDIGKFKKDFGEGWKDEFFKYCFGNYPEGKVDLRAGPVAIYWQCENLNDYALACNESPSQASKSFGQRKSLLDALFVKHGKN